MVAAVEIDGTAVLAGSGGYCVIAPLPHETTAHTLIRTDDLPVIFKVTGAIAHCMAVFHEDEGLIRVGIQVLPNLLNGGVHAAVQIDAGVVVTTLRIPVVGAFVVSQSCGVETLGPRQCRLKGATIGALITGRPGNNAGAILLPVNTQLHAINSGLGPFGIIGDRFVPMLDLVIPGCIGKELGLRAVALIVRLGHDIEAILVAQLVEARIVRVVGTTHRVDVVFLHQPQVTLHVLQINHGASDRVRIVPVDAP